MNKLSLLKSAICCAAILSSSLAVFSQKRAAAKSAAKPNPVVFAVLDDGKTVEPIASIVKGELSETANGGDEPKMLLSFTNSYYKPKTVYNLIFGGAANGAVTIVSSDVKAECQKNLATVTTQSAKAKLKGLVMGLATNAETANNASGLRRLPTAAERTEIESLIRAEFTKQGVSANAVKKLNYHNLTALDVDNDGKAEMVGSFWVESSAKERNTLFFIADKDAADKYKFGYSEYEKVTPDKIMSGDLKDLDVLGGELLLDTLDYNGDKTAEIFTIDRAFEGTNFYVYRRADGKWTRVFERYNYHCAY